MDKKLQTMLFPQGKNKALTLSYDDGVVQDRRLVALLNQYGIKSTFNIGAGVLGFCGQAKIDNKMVDISKIQPEEVATLYRGHEVAGHGLWHSALTSIDSASALYEIIEDRRQLELLVGDLVKSFAYPFGLTNKSVEYALKMAGYTAARLVESTYQFKLPTNFLQWHPTCHHKDEKLLDLAKQFCTQDIPWQGPSLFYLWGHAYEFDGDQNWEVIEMFCQYVAQYAEKIWFATNGEIVKYCKAYERLQFNVDATIVHNTSAIDVWFSVNGTNYCVQSGKTLNLL